MINNINHILCTFKDDTGRNSTKEKRRQGTKGGVKDSRGGGGGAGFNQNSQSSPCS